MHLYSRGSTPFFFSTGNKSDAILPSLYCLFAFFPENSIESSKALIPLRIFLKEGVQNFLFNGADLMWPGVYLLDSTKGFTEFDQGQPVIIYASTGLPVAVGRMMT